MSCGSITSYLGTCPYLPSIEKVELAMIGIANILFVAGAIYVAYMTGCTGLGFLACSEFWGLLIPSTLMCGAFFISIIKGMNQKN